MPSAAELIAQLNELPEEERGALATLFANDGGPVVKALRSKAFAAGKTEGKAGGTQAAAELEAARARVAELEEELGAVKAATPDAAAIEDRVKKAMQRQVDAEKARADRATADLTGERVTAFRERFGKALRDNRVLPEYADEVLSAKYADRYRVAEDGRVLVLKPGEEGAYEADDVAGAIALLAADVAKTVKPLFLASNADSGAGLTNGVPAAGGGGGYDPVAAGKAMAAATKTAAVSQSAAFR